MYAILILIAPAILYLSNRVKGLGSNLLVGIGLLLPCLVAGFRYVSVGTDMLVYGEWGYELSKNSDWIEYYSTFAGWHQIGFLIVTWIIGHFTESWVLYFGIIQALTIVPIYYVLGRHAKGYEWLGMYSYLTLIFPLSLNAMKQMIACSFAMLAISDAIEDKRLSFLIWIFIASTFHDTALIVLSFYPFIYFAKKGKYFQLAIVVTGIVGLAIATAPILLPLLAQIRPTFVFAIEHMSSGSTNNSILLLAFVFLAIHVVANINAIGYSSEHTDYPSVFLAIFLLGVLLMQLDIIATSVGRLGYYGYTFSVLWLPSFFAKKGEQIGILKYLLIACIACCFTYLYIIKGVGEIYPYQSVILGIW